MIKWLGIQFQRIHFGHMIYAKIGVIINLLILVGVYETPLWIKILITPVAVIALWLFGFIADKTQFRDHFMTDFQKILIKEIRGAKNKENSK